MWVGDIGTVWVQKFTHKNQQYSQDFLFFYWIDKYTLVQTNVNNKKTEIEIIQSQTKSKTSLPYYVHVMRDKTQKRKV